MAGAPVEDIGGDQQLVDLAGAGGVEVAEHHGGMAQSFSELGGGIGPDRAYLG